MPVLSFQSLMSLLSLLSFMSFPERADRPFGVEAPAYWG